MGSEARQAHQEQASWPPAAVLCRSTYPGCPLLRCSSLQRASLALAAASAQHPLRRGLDRGHRLLQVGMRVGRGDGHPAAMGGREGKGGLSRWNT